MPSSQTRRTDQEVHSVAGLPQHCRNDLPATKRDNNTDHQNATMTKISILGHMVDLWVLDFSSEGHCLYEFLRLC